MALADNLIETAQGLLTAFGQHVIFTNRAVSEYDPTSGTKLEVTDTYSGYVYISKFSAREIGAPFGSSLIKKDDLNVIATSMDRVPEEGDTMNMDGVAYRIMSVNKSNVNGTNVLYNLVARA